MRGMEAEHNSISMPGLLLVFLFIVNTFRAAPEQPKVRGTSESLSGVCHNWPRDRPKHHQRKQLARGTNETSKSFRRPSHTLPPPVSPLQIKKCAIGARRVRVDMLVPIGAPLFESNCASLKGFATKLPCWVSIEGNNAKCGMRSRNWGLVTKPH